MEPKKWYKSKTLWVNALAAVAVVVQAATGTAWFNPEAQAGALALVNMVLRIATSTGLE